MDVQSMFRFLVEVTALKDETRPDPNTPAYGLATFGCGKTALSGRMAMDITENSLRGNTDLVVRGYHDHPHYQVPASPRGPASEASGCSPRDQVEWGKGPSPAPRSCSPRDEVEWGKGPFPPYEGGKIRGLESIKLRADAAQAALVGASPPPRLLRRRYSPHR